MPANVGEMFYTGEMPWHGLGIPLARPATMEEALRAGGLNWEVREVDVQMVEYPPSPPEPLVRMSPARIPGLTRRKPWYARYSGRRIQVP